MATDETVGFGVLPDWKRAWGAMPEYNSHFAMPLQDVTVHLMTEQDREAFSELIGRQITPKTKSIYYPLRDRKVLVDKRYVTKTPVNPRHPVYVISKGRWESRLTVKALERMGVPYRVCVEPSEYRKYAKVIDPGKILKLPEDFSALGKGSIPVRNWAWEHSVAQGAERHWVLDDNIRKFMYQTDNIRIRLESGICFRAVEDFADRYTNVALAGMHYTFFAPPGWTNPPPFYLNTRVYSCILIRNDLPYRWRGRYNEDTDLSLRALKDGLCTVLFNVFKCDKMRTMTMKGGNTDELYKEDGRLKMAESLKKQHPGIVTITKKWGRWQHQVDYRGFKRNRLVPNPDYVPPEDVHGYQLELVKVPKSKSKSNGEPRDEA